MSAVAEDARLACPPGKIGALAQYIYSTAGRPMWEVALAYALGFVAGIAGRVYHTEYNPTGLNLYLLVLAKTGFGKEDGKKGIERLLHAVQMAGVPHAQNFIGPGSLASGQALIHALNSQPGFLGFMDECSDTLKRLTNPRAANYDRELARLIKHLYTLNRPDGVLRPHVYADRTKNTYPVFAPNMTLVGDTTQSAFKECMEHEQMTDGLFPRFDVLEYSDEKCPLRNKRTAGEPPPTAVVQAVVDLMQEVAKLDSTVMLLDGEPLAKVVRPQFRAVPQEPVAMALLDAFCDECDADRSKSSVDDVEAALLSRLHLKALRIAANIAVFDNPVTPVVTAEMAAWAIAFERCSKHTMWRPFAKGEVGSGDAAKAQGHLLKAIDQFLAGDAAWRRAGNKGISPAFRDGLVIPYAFLEQYAKCRQPFKKDHPRILDKTLETLCNTEKLDRLTPPDKAQVFGADAAKKITTNCYRIRDNF